MNERKTRSDAIVRGLPAEQRAVVDGWLFGGNRGYAAVAELCGREFGIQVSKSSVGRYYETESVARMQRAREERARAQWEGLSVEEKYQRVLLKIMGWVAAELNGPKDQMERRWVVRMMRVVIAARRERNDRVFVAVERGRFEQWAAKRVLKEWRLSHGWNTEKTRKRKWEDDKEDRNERRQEPEEMEGYAEMLAEFRRKWGDVSKFKETGDELTEDGRSLLGVEPKENLESTTDEHGLYI